MKNRLFVALLASGIAAAGFLLPLADRVPAADLPPGDPPAADPLAADPPAADPLAAYVAKADASYGWKVRREGKLGSTRYVELTLTSQTWRGIVWKHQLYLLRPSTAKADATHGLLLIEGGDWRAELEDPAGDERLPGEANLFALAAERLGTLVAIVRHVPQQPMFGGLREDQIISLTFEEYLRSRDPEWLLLLPMVKSAVRAMDAADEFAREHWDMALETFTVTGASKRGWTTWLTAAVDPRVTALAPMVIDVLNFREHLAHQKAVWGDYSPMIRDYTRRGLPEHLETEAGRQLAAIVDPYHYLARITQPKLLLIGTNDPYWPVDSLNLYWEAMVGPKHVLYVPNNGHGLSDTLRVVGSLSALHRQAAAAAALPRLAWEFEENADAVTVRITSDRRPLRVQLWTAAAPTRDFRRAEWTAAPATNDGDVYRASLPRPQQGYAALFGEAVYAGGIVPYYLSTNVRIIEGGAE